MIIIVYIVMQIIVVLNEIDESTRIMLEWIIGIFGQ